MLLPNEVIEEINILKDKKYIHINQVDKNIIEKLYKEIPKFDKVILIYPHETLTSLYLWNEIYKIIEVYDYIDIRIMTSTASTFSNSTHPLTNLLMWKNLRTRIDLTWDFRNSDFIFDKNKFYRGKKLNRKNKSIKYIISTRKNNEIRDYIFSKIQWNRPHQDGICRYYYYPDYGDESDYLKNCSPEDIEALKNSPTIYELIEEYENSFFSFVIESSRGEINENFHTNLTEKTVLAFITGTIPIFHGGKNYVKELNQMGFYTWNDEYGFKNGDDFSNYSHYKSDLFINCFDKVYNLNLKECEKKWDEYYHKIQHNYDLVCELIFNDDLISEKICNTN
jgi:hypothetical protein